MSEYDGSGQGGSDWGGSSGDGRSGGGGSAQATPQWVVDQHKAMEAARLRAMGGGPPVIGTMDTPQWIADLYGYGRGPRTTGQSAMALEERLRADARKNVKPNVEFGFNLEKTPSAPKPPSAGGV